MTEENHTLAPPVKKWSKSTNGFYDTGIHSVIPNDAVVISDEDWSDYINHPGLRSFNDDGSINVLDPPPPNEAEYEYAIQSLVDAKAQEKQFRDGVTLASYITSTQQAWASQAQAFVAWRDAIWAYSYIELAKVKAGIREQPNVADFLVELPSLVWPEA